MKMTFKKAIDKLMLNPLTIDMTYKYTNNVALSGWIVRKPKYIKHDTKNIESCSFLLNQISNFNGVVKIETFSCVCYVKDLVEQIKKQKNILFVAIVGKVRHHYKYGDYTQVVEMQTLAEIDLPLANEWGKDK